MGCLWKSNAAAESSPTRCVAGRVADRSGSRGSFRQGHLQARLPLRRQQAPELGPAAVTGHQGDLGLSEGGPGSGQVLPGPEVVCWDARSSHPPCPGGGGHLGCLSMRRCAAVHGSSRLKCRNPIGSVVGYVARMAGKEGGPWLGAMPPGGVTVSLVLSTSFSSAGSGLGPAPRCVAEEGAARP